MIHLGDITAIKGGDIPPADIITFGSPCQNFSVAGNGEGLEGGQSSLILHATRIIGEMLEATNGKYPAFFVWENVPGAFSTPSEDKGEDFRKVLESFAGICERGTSIPRPPGGKWRTAGAVMGDNWSITWRIMDAQFWGVPQRRRRIYLVADIRGQRAGEILFKPEGVPGYSAEGGGEGQGTPGTTTVGTDSPILCFNGRQDPVSGAVAGAVDSTLPQAQCVVSAHKIRSSADFGGTEYLTPWDAQSFRIMADNGGSPTLSGCDGGGGRSPAGYVAVWPDINGTLTARFDSSPQAGRINQIRCIASGQAGAAMLEDISPTLNCNHEQPYVVGVVGCNAVDCRNFREEPEISGTLQAKGSSGSGYSLNCQNPVRMGCELRRLTPMECERLQGFPDNWTRWGVDERGKVVEIADSPRYRAIGNSIAIPNALRVISAIKEVIERRGCNADDRGGIAAGYR